MVIGYARVSTIEQNLDRQIDALRQYGVDEIYYEKVSGTKSKRKELELVLHKLRKNDTLVVYELKRLGRKTSHLIDLMETFEKNKINFVSISENIDTSTSIGKFILSVFCALAQLDRDIISENTKSGLRAAKLRGLVGGRKRIPKDKIKLALNMYYSKDYFIKEIIEEVGISKSTLYNYINMNKKTEDEK